MEVELISTLSETSIQPEASSSSEISAPPEAGNSGERPGLPSSPESTGAGTQPEASIQLETSTQSPSAEMSIQPETSTEPEASEKGSQLEFQTHMDVTSSAERADVSADKRGTAHPLAELAKVIVESAETGWKAAEVLTKDKVVTGIERSLAAVSRGTYQAADALASKAPDSVARTLYGAHDRLANAVSKPAGQRVRDIAEKTAFRVVSGIIEGGSAALEAHERGVGPVATALDAGAVGIIAAKGFGGPIDQVINAVHGIVNGISPEAGQYTGVVASVTPSKMAEDFTVGTIDTIAAIVKGDSNQLIQHHEQNLQGKYGETLRHYAIAFDFLGANITGDKAALDRLAALSASGQLGPVAKFGDWLGGTLHDKVMQPIHWQPPK